MRLLIASQTYAPSVNGQAVFARHLAEGLAQRGHRVVVITPAPGFSGDSLRQKGVTIVRVGAVPLTFIHANVFFTPLPFDTIQSLFDSLRPEVVHIQDHYPLNYWTALEAHRRNVPVMGTNHFMPQNLAPHLPHPKGTEEGLARLLWWWMQQTFNSLDVTTAPSRTAVSILRQQGLSTPALPITCGVDLSRFRVDKTIDRAALRRQYGLDPARPLLLFVGRVDGEKRLDVLLRGLGLLARPEVQLAIAGKGKALSESRALAAELGLEEQVHFLGYVPDADLPGLLNSTDLFVMPSEAELLSIATLEAMACAKPVLAADALALPELVKDGVNGRLFRAGDPADAARALAWLIEQRAEWAAMGEAGRQLAQAHSLSAAVEQYETVYRALIARRKDFSALVEQPATNEQALGMPIPGHCGDLSVSDAGFIPPAAAARKSPTAFECTPLKGR